MQNTDNDGFKRVACTDSFSGYLKRVNGSKNVELALLNYTVMLWEYFDAKIGSECQGSNKDPHDPVKNYHWKMSFDVDKKYT